MKEQLFVLYTNECQCHYEGRHIIKLVYDSIIVSLLNYDETDHGPVVDEFSAWCKHCFLDINISKTKKMIIDFRRKHSPILPAVIYGQAGQVVQYLATIIDNKLTHDTILMLFVQRPIRPCIFIGSSEIVMLTLPF